MLNVNKTANKLCVICANFIQVAHGFNVVLVAKHEGFLKSFVPFDAQFGKC